MASFVESATLLVNDQASAKINKINAELKKLFATAKSLKSFTINIKVNAQGLSKAAADAKSLATALRSLRSAARGIKISVNTSGLAQAQRQIAALQRQAQRPINVATRGTAAGAQVGPRRPRTQTQGAVRGFVSGMGTGMSDLIVSYGAVAAAGYLAAAALRSVATNAATRDRTQLQSAVAATEAQRKVFAQQDKLREALRPEERPPLPFTKDVRDQLRTSLLGEVSAQMRERTGMDPLDPRLTPQQRVEAQERRAVASDKLTDYLERNVVPQLYALDPKMTQQQTAEGLHKIVQAVNLGSTDMTDAQGNLSKDAHRVFKGIMMAQYAQPELEPGEIKTAMANLKGAAFTMSPDALASTLINASSRGQRAANEAYRTQKAMMGTVDVAKVNNMLADEGLLQKTRRNRYGNVEPGSGRPVDERMLLEDPAQWYQKNYIPRMDKVLKQEADARVKALAKTASAQEREQAGLITNADRRAYIERKMAGASATAIQGMVDIILGNTQMREQLAQAQDAMAQDPAAALRESWTTAAANVVTAWSDAAASVGAQFAKAINLNQILGGVADFIRQNPKTAVGAAVGGATLGAAGLAIAFRPLMSAGPLLISAAGALSGAANVLKTGAAANAAAPGGAAAVGGKKGGLGWMARAAGIIGGAAAFLLASTEPAGGETNLPEHELTKKLIDKDNQIAAERTKVQQALEEAKREGTEGGTPEQQSEARELIRKLEAQNQQLTEHQGEVRKLLHQMVPEAVPAEEAARRQQEEAAKTKAAADEAAARAKQEEEKRARVPLPKKERPPEPVKTEPVKPVKVAEPTKAAEPAKVEPIADAKAIADSVRTSIESAIQSISTQIEAEAAKTKADKEAVKPRVEPPPAAEPAAPDFGATFQQLQQAPSWLPLLDASAANIAAAGPQLAAPLATVVGQLSTAGGTFAASFTAAASALTMAQQTQPAWLASLQTAMQQQPTWVASLANIGTTVAAPLTAAAGQISASAASFQGAFQSGAAAIASSGAQAASALQAGAAGAGAALGAAAVSAIRAGVSGLSINVNAHVTSTSGGTDTGAQKGD